MSAIPVGFFGPLKGCVSNCRPINDTWKLFVHWILKSAEITLPYRINRNQLHLKSGIHIHTYTYLFFVLRPIFNQTLQSEIERTAGRYQAQVTWEGYCRKDIWRKILGWDNELSLSSLWRLQPAGGHTGRGKSRKVSATDQGPLEI